MRKILIIFSFLTLSGCATYRYENFTIINSPKDIVFMVLEDYENYPNIIPELHSTVEIISENRTGLGVQFINISTFGGRNTKSIYEIVGYGFNEYIKMINRTHFGRTELFVENLNENKTRYTLINYIRIPFFMRNRLFKIFDEELEIIKGIIESKY
jgi:hypothetical protein